MGGTASVNIYNEEIPNSKEPGFTPIYRRKGVKQLATTPEEGINTMADLIKVIVKRYGKQQGLGIVLSIQVRSLLKNKRTKKENRFRLGPLGTVDFKISTVLHTTSAKPSSRDNSSTNSLFAR